MVGTSASTADRPEPNTPGAPVLKLNGLSTLGDRGLEAFSNLSFQVNAGEIIGIAGVAGNGQRRASRCDRRAQTFHQWFVVNERC